MARDLTTLTNAELREAYHAARALQVNASRVNRASGVFAMERELDACYAEADRRGIALLRPELDPPADRSAGSYLPGERSALELSQAYAAAIDEADAKRAERASDLIHDGIGLRARGGLVYFG